MGNHTFQAGEIEPQTYVVRMNLYRAGYDDGRGTMLARFVEFWCQMNCGAHWRVDQTAPWLAVSFASTTDCVLFLISHEYTFFKPSATIRPHLTATAAFRCYPQ